DFPNKTLTLLDGTDIPLVIGREIPAPMQGDQSVDDYFKMIKIYAVALGIDLDNQGLKETFFSGDDSVIEYFAKLNKCNKSFEYKEEQLKYQFLRGLTPDNQLEVRRCGLELPLDELVEKL
ncbi:13017_t:CDS:2, partial [Entrophospora sp. SA101]